MKYALGITTTQSPAAVCLLTDVEVVASREWVADRFVGTALLAEITSLLAEAGITATEITRIAVVRGPGHFSAVRAGIATGTFLAEAWGDELVGVTTLSVAAVWEALPVAVIEPQYEAPV